MAYDDSEYIAALESIVGSNPQQAIPNSGNFLIEQIANVGRGAIGLGEAAIGAGNIATGGALQRAIGDYYRPEEAKQTLADWGFTEERKRQEQNIQNAEGFWDTAGEIASSPRAMLGRGIEMLPGMVGAGMAGKALSKAAPAISEMTGAAIGEGALTAAQQGQQVIGNDPMNVSGMYAQLPAGAITGVISRVAGKYGGNVETALVGGGERAVGNLGQRFIKGVLGEGVFEELPQSAQEQIWQNIAEGKNWYENVDKAAAEGVVLGGVMGGGISAVTGRPDTTDADARAERDRLLAERATREEALLASGLSKAEAAEILRQENASRGVGENLSLFAGGTGEVTVPGADPTIDMVGAVPDEQMELGLRGGATAEELAARESGRAPLPIIGEEPTAPQRIILPEGTSPEQVARDAYQKHQAGELLTSYEAAMLNRLNEQFDLGLELPDQYRTRAAEPTQGDMFDGSLGRLAQPDLQPPVEAPQVPGADPQIDLFGSATPTASPPVPPAGPSGVAPFSETIMLPGQEPTAPQGGQIVTPAAAQGEIVIPGQATPAPGAEIAVPEGARTAGPAPAAAQVSAEGKQVRGKLGTTDNMAKTANPADISADLANLVSRSWLEDATTGDINYDAPMVFDIRSAKGRQQYKLNVKVGQMATAVARLYRALARLDATSRITPFVEGESGATKPRRTRATAMERINAVQPGGVLTYRQLNEGTGGQVILKALKAKFGGNERTAYTYEQLQAVKPQIEARVIQKEGVYSDVITRDAEAQNTASTEVDTALAELRKMFGKDQEAYDAFMADMMRRVKEDKFRMDKASMEAIDEAMAAEDPDAAKSEAGRRAARNRFDVLVSAAIKAQREGRTARDIGGGEVRGAFEEGTAPNQFASATAFLTHLRETGTAYEKSLGSILKRFIDDTVRLEYQLEVNPPKGTPFGEAIDNGDGTYTIILRRNSPDVFLHEAIHVATMQWINGHPNHGAVTRLVNAFHQAKAAIRDGKLEKSGLLPEQIAAVKEIFRTIDDAATGENARYFIATEFMAYTMANPDMAAFLRSAAESNLAANNLNMQADLASIRAEGAKRGNVFTALYEALRNFFRQVFGTKDGNTILDRVVNETLLIMEAVQTEPKPAKPGVAPALRAAVSGVVPPGNVPPVENPTTQATLASLKELSRDDMGWLDATVKALFAPIMPWLGAGRLWLDEKFSQVLKASPGLTSFLNNFVDNLAVERNWPAAAEALASYSTTRNGAAAIGNMVEDVLRTAPQDMVAPIINALDDPAKIAELPADLKGPATVLREKIIELRDAANATGALDPSLRDALPSELIQYAEERSDITSSGFSLGLIKRSNPQVFKLNLVRDEIVGVGDNGTVAQMVGRKFYLLPSALGGADTMATTLPPTVTADEYTLARVEGDTAIFERTHPKNDPRTMSGARAAINLANTVAYMSKIVASHQFVKEIQDINGPGTPVDSKFLLTEEEAKFLGRTADYEWSGFSGHNLHAVQRELARSPSSWVKLEGKSWGELDGMLINGSVLAALSDMHSQGKFISSPTYNRALVLWKQGKTGISPATHVTNVMSSFLMAYMHDIPLSSIAKAFKIVYAAQYPNGVAGKFKPEPLTAEEQQIYNAFIGSGALMGNFSSNELHGKMLADISKNLTDNPGEQDGSGYALGGKLAEIEGVKKAYDAAIWAKTKTQAGWQEATKLYENEDNVFRMAAFMTKMGELQRKSPDMAQDAMVKEAGKFAKYAMIDYNINARGVNAMRQTFWPFLAWPYRAMPMLAKVAIEKPWKMGVIMGVVYGLNALAYAASGDDEEEERKNSPEWARNRLFGMPVGPYSMVRVPFVGDHEHPTYFNVGKWVPGGDIFTNAGEPVLGMPGVPSFLTPGGPVAASLFAAAGYDTFRGETVYKDAAPVSENMAAALGLLTRQLSPNLPVQMYDVAEKWGRADALGKPVDMAYNVLRTVGLKTYTFDAETEQYKQNAEIAALQREMKTYIKQQAKMMWREGEIDYDELRQIQLAGLERLNERANEIKGIA